MTSLAEIRAKLLEKDSKAGGNFQGGSNDIYAFWNIPEGSTATLRFLPDGNSSNTFFWQERLIIRLPFEGIKGQPDAKNIIVQVPCVEMWDRTCPVLSEVRGWFKDKDADLEALGRKYWKKRSFIFQGFVINDPMEESDIPENPIRRFVINRSIFEIIKSSLMDPEMEELPIDFQAGRDFKLTKTKRGQYADYSTSNWSMRTRSLTEAELDAINTYGLFDLKDYLPKEPNDQDLEIIAEMFEASVNGEKYDPDRWSNHYKPYGFNGAENNSTIDTAKKAALRETVKEKTETENVDDDTPPFDVDEETKEEPATTSGEASVKALNKLKERVQESKEEDDTSESSSKEAASLDEKPDHSQILEMIKKRRKSS